MIKTEYQGYIDIQAWEYALIPLYLLVIFLITSSIKNRRIKKNPEYRYYLWGLYAKIIGGLMFALIYVFYYGSGDTISYYESGRAMANMLEKDPGTFLKIWLLPASPELFAHFGWDTGWLVGWFYEDPRALMVVRLITPLVIIGFKSYFLTTILVSWVTYEGLWRLYLMFVRYYPQLMGPLATAVLFMPSTVFWGSGIMKDPFTMAATGLYVALIDQVFVRRNFKFRGVLVAVIAAYLLVSLKPYIFMVLFPGTLYWVFNQRISRIRNALVKFVVLPVVFIGVFALSLFVLEQLGDTLGKFSLENALETAAITSGDLRSERSGGNSFNIGEFEPTWIGALGKFGPATMAGLFRPYVWEVRNVVMLLSALENVFLLVLTIRLLWRTKLIRLLRTVFRDPLVAFCMLYAVSFGFVIGLSTSNFGSLVRFKIPMLPFFVAALYITLKLYAVPKKKGLGAPLHIPQKRSA